jgi:hypothetical protein
VTTQQHATRRRSDSSSTTRVRLTHDALVVHASGHLDARTRALISASFKSACNAARSKVIAHVVGVRSCDPFAAEELAAGVRHCVAAGRDVEITSGPDTPEDLVQLLDAAATPPAR